MFPFPSVYPCAAGNQNGFVIQHVSSLQNEFVVYYKTKEQLLLFHGVFRTFYFTLRQEERPGEYAIYVALKRWSGLYFSITLKCSS